MITRYARCGHTRLGARVAGLISAFIAGGLAGCAAPRAADQEAAARPQERTTEGFDEATGAASASPRPVADEWTAGVEATSPSGRAYFARKPGDDPEQERLLAEARRALQASPDDVERVIWVGRRLGYLWRMNDAIAQFSAGMQRHPRSGPLFRHRGHRYLSIRRFDDAVRDLERAAQLIRGRPDAIEPDGLPNELNAPLTTTAFNVWYHLALGRYLKGDYAAAHDAYLETLKHSYRHDDNLVATTYWLYLTLRKLGRHNEAEARLEAVSTEMRIVENHAYHDLLLLFKGRRTEEQLRARHTDGVNAATIRYGVGMWHLLDGRTHEARAAFEQAVSGPDWPAFGFIAAEVELARL